jgi:hypothetical protein
VCHEEHLTEFILYGNEEDDDARLPNFLLYIFFKIPI